MATKKDADKDQKKTSTEKADKSTKASSKNSTTTGSTKSYKSDSVTRPPKLLRSSQDNVIAGVAGGIGEYFNIDPVIIRIIFVTLALADGIGFMLYLILWVIIPSRGSESLSTEEAIKSNTEEIKTKVQDISKDVSSELNQSRKGTNWWAILLIGLGIFLMVNTLEIFEWSQLTEFWPLALIFLGLFMLAKK